MKAVALALIRLYQLTLSPLLGTRCRFHPTCSVYTQEAITKYGFLRGVYLGGRRLPALPSFSRGRDGSRT